MRQWNEFGFTGNFGELPPLPSLLGIFDALVAGGDEIPPDVPRRRESLASQQHRPSLADGAKPKPALAVSAKGESLSNCFWVANDRLACRISVNIKDPTFGILPANRLMAVNVSVLSIALSCW